MGSLRKAEVEIMPGKKSHQEKAVKCALCSRVSYCTGDQPKLQGMGGMGEGTLSRAGNKSHEKKVMDQSGPQKP